MQLSPSPFDLVSQNLKKLGAITITQFLPTSPDRQGSKDPVLEPENDGIHRHDSHFATDSTTDLIGAGAGPDLPGESTPVEPSLSRTIDPDQDARVLQIEQACTGKTTPRWILYTNREVQIDPVLRYGAALYISGITPHTGQVYSTDTFFPTESSAKSACAALALVQGILTYIQRSHYMFALSPPVTLATRPPTALSLQAFYETLPRPFPEDVGEKTAAEINAPTWINITLNSSSGTRLKPFFHWQTDPTCGLVGCLLRLSCPTTPTTQHNNKAYIVPPVFLKRADAKAAVCLLAMSQDISAHIHATPDKTMDMSRMKRLANRVFAALATERTKLRLGGQSCRYVFESVVNAHGCTLHINIGTPTTPHTRTYTAPAQYRSKADAKTAVVCLAAEQGVIEFMRFRGEPPPEDGSYIMFWEEVQGMDTEKDVGGVDVGEKKEEKKGVGVGGKRKEREDDEEGKGMCEEGEEEMQSQGMGKGKGKGKGKQKEVPEKEQEQEQKSSKKAKKRRKRGGGGGHGDDLEDGEITGTPPVANTKVGGKAKKALGGGVSLSLGGNPNPNLPPKPKPKPKSKPTGSLSPVVSTYPLPPRPPWEAPRPGPSQPHMVASALNQPMTFGGSQLAGYTFKPTPTPSTSRSLPNFTRHKGAPPPPEPSYLPGEGDGADEYDGKEKRDPTSSWCSKIYPHSYYERGWRPGDYMEDTRVRSSLEGYGGAGVGTSGDGANADTDTVTATSSMTMTKLNKNAAIARPGSTTHASATKMANPHPIDHQQAKRRSIPSTQRTHGGDIYVPRPRLDRYVGSPLNRQPRDRYGGDSSGHRENARRVLSGKAEGGVFLQASADRPTTPSLLLVCKTAHQWILPVLYHTIAFLSARQISSFHATHDPLSNPHTHILFSLIKNLWIGDSGEDMDTTLGLSHFSDLQYGSTSWPITIIDRILRRCTHLRSLYIVKLDQNEWHRLEGAIPASLESLAMGPVHGPFHINDLTSKPRLRSFTSCHTYMRDDEVRDVVMYPSMRVFRRIWHAGVDVDVWAGGQEACVAKSGTLVEMKLVVCGRDVDEEAMERIREATGGDARVTVETSEVDGMELVYAEFLEERRKYIASLTQIA